MLSFVGVLVRDGGQLAAAIDGHARKGQGVELGPGGGGLPLPWLYYDQVVASPGNESAAVRSKGQHASLWVVSLEANRVVGLGAIPDREFLLAQACQPMAVRR